MGAKSGRFGLVNGKSTTTKWSINQTSSSQSFVASNTRGGTGRTGGPQDWTGSYEGLGHTPGVMPGEYFDFLGLTGPDSGVEGEAGVAYSGNAIVESVSITWNWETNQAISYSVSFGGNGQLEEVTQAAADGSQVAVFETKGCIFTFDGDTPDFGLTTATLTITAANQTYVDSSTGGWTKRSPGPIDATLSVTINHNSITTLPFEEGDSVNVKAFINDTLFWDLKWMLIESFSNIGAERASGKIVSMTINTSLNAAKDGAVGWIKKPGGTAFWPAGA